MIQLTELKEHRNVGKDEIIFTLVFTDDSFLDQLWSLVETCLRDYEYHGSINVVAETKKEDKKYIELYVAYPVSDISNREMENNLEVIKEDFVEYYQKLIHKIKLIPVLKN
ncbi:MAG TPA: hypothetical protein VGC02_04565 [Methanobacterium sp.]